MAAFLLNGKGAFLIAGYNTMSKSEKAEYDERALCRFMGWFLIALSLSILLVPAGIYLKAAWLTYCGIALTFAETVGTVIFMNTGKRFRKSRAGTPPPNGDGRTGSPTRPPAAGSPAKPSASKTGIVAASIITGIVLIATCALFYQGDKEPVVELLDDGIKIKALYGQEVAFSDMAGISLLEKSMDDIGVDRRTNGYGGVSGALRGHFRSDALGEILLFVQSQSSPTIWIERNTGEDIYLSLRDGERTEQLYHEITAAAGLD
jgi:hypothetical protein